MQAVISKIVLCDHFRAHDRCRLNATLIKSIMIISALTKKKKRSLDKVHKFQAKIVVSVSSESKSCF